MSPKKSQSVKVAGKSSVKSSAALIPQPHGGALLPGAGGGPQPGAGRPKDEVRAKYLSLGATKGFDFLDSLLDGKVTVSLLGKCDACAHEQPISEEIVHHILERVGVSIDHRLKANDQAMKYGTQAKELVIADNPQAEQFFNCITRAAAERWGDEGAAYLKARAVALMDGKA